MRVGIRKDGRGLVFTLDLVASLFFFLVIIVTVLWLFGQTHGHVNEARMQDARQRRLMDLSSMLVKSRGNPSDWHTEGSVDSSSVDALGLAKESNVLSPAKLQALVDANYNELKTVMGLGSEDFNISVIGNYADSPNVLYSIGNVTDTGEVRVISRYALLDGQRVLVKLEAYYDKR